MTQMTRYSTGRTGGLHVDVGDVTHLFSGGQTNRLHTSVTRTHHVAMRAKKMPNVGSTEARQRGLTGKWKNKLFDRIRVQASKRADGGDINAVLGDTWQKLGAKWDRIWRLEAHAERLEFIASLEIDFISDAAEFALGLIYEALNFIVDELFQMYCETMYMAWSSHEVAMNNGQITLTETYFFPEITNFLAEQLNTGPLGEQRWPFDTNTWDYAFQIEQAYDMDVWIRAFSDTTNSPIAVCEEIRETAVYTKLLSGF